MDIQVIIRASNQNIDDQVIHCNTDWTILHLKYHLSEVYPSRPSFEGQKLIYSGRLLQNHLQLKDIIRHEDMQSSSHILHIVCSENNYTSSPLQTTHSSQNQSSQHVQLSGLSNENAGTSSENIVRHRLDAQAPQTNNIQTQFQQVPVNPLTTFYGDPQVVAQMAVLQQMYAQYISQYWQSINLATATGNSPFIPVVSSIQTQQNNPTNVSQDNVPQQHADQRNNAPALQPVEDNGSDWLDHLFLYFRFLVLLCIIYFYTTPERFMVVIIIVMVGFLYREGWFMRHGIADAVRAQMNRGQAEPNPNEANEQPPANVNEGIGYELEAAMDGEDPPHAQNPDAANNNNNQVFSPLTFLATFFSSLIPETPPPVNIN